MNDPLKAIYQASLQTQSHAVFYSLPNKLTTEGIISESVQPVTDHTNGFIIGSFDPQIAPVLIPGDFSFNYDNELRGSARQRNNFTESLYNFFQANLNSELPDLEPYHNSQIIYSASKEEFIDSVLKAQNEIANGSIKKVVMSRVSKFNYKKTNDVIDIYRTICLKNREAFVSLVSSPLYGTWIGASPEILLKQNGDRYTTVALAGTKKTDQKSAFTSKEYEEQNIIKEYIEDILGFDHIKTKSSEVQNQKAGLLTHLRTKLEFISSPYSRLHIALALHPTPAVGGYPKENSLDFIKKHEGYDRELYTGYLGFIDEFEMSLFVNIRCMKWKPDHALIFAGCGITSASDPESEWIESENKMEVISGLI